MSASQLPEGTPIVCRQCGGSMLLQGETTVICRYCGQRDQLPPDETGRYLEIRSRLNAARDKTAQVHGMEAALARIFEDRRAFFRVSALYLAVGLIIAADSAASLVSLPTLRDPAVPSNVRAQLLLHHINAPTLMFGLAASFGLALLVGRSHYRRAVRPFLLARPVDMGGSHFACRACGGTLATSSDVAVTCRYCNSTNLIPTETHAASGEALRRHAAEAGRTVNTAHAHVGTIGRRMQLILGIGVVASMVLGYGLPTFLGAVLGLGGR